MSQRRLVRIPSGIFKLLMSAAFRPLSLLELIRSVSQENLIKNLLRTIFKVKNLILK